MTRQALWLPIGATGSGKTNFLLPVLQQIIAGPQRNLILDVKGDFTEMLRYPCDFILVAPWDRRGWRWDLARDVTHGYALMTHKAQGATVDRVFVRAGTWRTGNLAWCN